MIRAKCGKTKSNSGKLFTEQTKIQHEDSCAYCKGVVVKQEDAFPLTNIIADDDMPDGAFFALAWELGEL